MGPSWLIVGLGNPGAGYAETRHNVGFWCLDRLAAKHRLSFNIKRAQSLVARGRLAGQDVALAKPQTYMNLSGTAVKQLLVGWGVPSRSLLVVYDDADLPIGTLRLRARGGVGTHNGMRSLAESLGTTDFPRLRLGIGAAPPNRDIADYVLERPTSEELPLLEAAVSQAVEAVELILRRGLEAAMNAHNRGTRDDRRETRENRSGATEERQPTEVESA